MTMPLERKLSQITDMDEGLDISSETTGRCYLCAKGHDKKIQLSHISNWCCFSMFRNPRKRVPTTWWVCHVVVSLR